MKHLRELGISWVLGFLIFAVGPAASQGLPPQAPRDPGAGPPATPAGTGSISGTVVVSDSGQPARRARVTLSAAEQRPGRSVTTDDFGRFVFPHLPEGRFTVSASKAGHVPVTYGQRRPGTGQPGTPIHLADGQQIELQLQMPRGGVLTGVVLDEHGDAIPGTQVRAMRYVTHRGHRTLQQAGTGTTDDRGVYRIYGLQPGEYIVGATPRNTSSAGNVERLAAEAREFAVRAEAVTVIDAAEAREMMDRAAAFRSQMPALDEQRAGYAPVYYPGTTSAASAGTIAVDVSQERTGIDFQLQLVPMTRIEGIVVTSDSEAPQNVQVSLVNLAENVPGIGNGSARPDAEGRFRIPNVPPGQYMVVARGRQGGRGGVRGGRGAAIFEGLGRGRAMIAAQPALAVSDGTRLWAMTEIAVDGGSVANVVLTLQPGMSVSGRVAFEPTTLHPPSDLSRLRVSVAPVEAGAGRVLATTVTGSVEASGRFTIDGVAPGTYRLSATNAGTGWVMASALVGAHDALDFPFEVKPNQSVSDAVITFTDRQADLSGTIVNSLGEPAPEYTIVVYSADRSYWMPQSRRIVSTRPGTDGRYTFRNLPPGEYRIAPVLDPEPGAWYDPAFLQQLDNTALRVSIAEGEKKVQNLRIALGGTDGR